MISDTSFLDVRLHPSQNPMNPHLLAAMRQGGIDPPQNNRATSHQLGREFRDQRYATSKCRISFQILRTSESLSFPPLDYDKILYHHLTSVNPPGNLFLDQGLSPGQAGPSQIPAFAGISNFLPGTRASRAGARVRRSQVKHTNSQVYFVLHTANSCAYYCVIRNSVLLNEGVIRWSYTV